MVPAVLWYFSPISFSVLSFYTFTNVKTFLYLKKTPHLCALIVSDRGKKIMQSGHTYSVHKTNLYAFEMFILMKICHSTKL